jgi:xylan 1,4-beta-xylosidase
MESTRRAALRALAAGALAAPGLARAAGSAAGPSAAGGQGRITGAEGQRRADLGNGYFLNPVVAGDHADPTVLKDGDDYYMTCSSFVSSPGAVIWHSRDLVNWTPICAALNEYIGDAWAMDLIKHKDRYFIYIPISAADGSRTFVIWADDIRGPWSDPVDLKLPGCIDPGHVVGEDGKRYLFVNGIRKIALTDDGLSTVGKLEHAYSPWQYPEDWVVEMFAPEGPKLFRRGEWFYLVTAVGGTSGPPTSHMVIAARSRSIHGPWEHCPHNPLVRTHSVDEPWWSRGHASLVEGPAGDWWMIYHGYENGFRTLGRQILLEPVEWMEDGWFRALGGDLSKPMLKPRQADDTRPVQPHGMALSDDFSTNRIGVQWAFQQPGSEEMKRVSFVPGALTIAGKGRSPADCSPLTMIVGDHRYEATVTLDVLPGGEGGLLLFYSERMFVGVGFTQDEMRTFNYGQEHSWMRAPMETSTVMIRLRNDDNVVTMHYSHDGRNWTRHPWQMEVSGMHHNVLGGFLSLRPAIYSAGAGAIRLRDFRYRALPT